MILQLRLAEAKPSASLLGAACSLVTLKKDYDIAAQSAHDLLQMVVTNPTWSWADNPVLLGTLKAHMKSTEAFKTSEPFWEDWTTKTEYAKHVRSKYNLETVVHQQETKGKETQDVITRISAEVSRLENTHASFVGS